MTEPRRYCVIGAGAAGLAAIEALRDAAIAFDCFEASDRVGGHWHDGYASLHLITARDTSGYAGHPMPASYPLFPSRAQMLGYILGFAEARDLVRHVRFGTAVTRVSPRGDDVEVETDDGARRAYAGVVVANGHLRVPHVPALPGAFDGAQVHSGRYRDVGDVAGERVLVVGSGNSGCDLAVDCAQAGLRTTIAIRRGHLFQPKTFAGRPRAELPLMRLPARLQDLAVRGLIRLSVGPPERYGLPAPATWDLNAQKPVVNTQLLHWLHHGRIDVAPGLAALQGDRVRFADGSVRPFDTILWATGFDVSLPFLDPALLRFEDGVPLRVAGATLPAGGPARVYLLGLTAPRGGQLPVYSAQAALVVRMLAHQEGRREALAVAFAARERPDRAIDVVRSRWQQSLDRAHAVLDELEGRPRSRAAGRLALRGAAR